MTRGGELARFRFSSLQPEALLQASPNRFYKEVLGIAGLQEQGFIRGLLTALAARDVETVEHCRRVTVLTLLLARKLQLDPQLTGELALGATLHDVGKIAIPDRILHKRGRLTREEYQEMMKHPLLGVQMVQDLATRFPTAVAIIRHHHERHDGSGYPDGLKGEEVPLPARLFAVVDAFDVMTHDRPYRRARSVAAAREELLRLRGTQFCPECVDAFLALELGELLSILPA